MSTRFYTVLESPSRPMLGRAAAALRRMPLLLGLGLIVLVARPSAQSLSTASIIGHVVDDSGSVLPGVTVSVSGPALQVPQLTAVTDAQGEYRISGLPPGVYESTYALQGFASIKHSELRLTAGFVAKMDVVLKVASLSETVTVIAASPIVDVTSVETRTSFLKENLEAIPTSRNSINTLLNQAPGVNGRLDIGGSQTATLPSMPVFGHPGQSEPMIEGINGREATGNLGGSYYDYSTFEEAQVETVAHSAEAATAGVLLNAITKSGGNTFHGKYYAGGESPRFQSNNIDSALKTQGVTSGDSIQKRWDFSGDLGGLIVPDKLWFYGAARRQRMVNGVVGLLAEDGISPGYDPTQITFMTGKLSYQPSSSQKIVGFRQFFKKDVIGGGSAFVPYDSQWHLIQPGANQKVEWTGTFGDSAVAEAMWGNSWYESNINALSSAVATNDIVTQLYTGQQYNQYTTPRDNHIWRNQFKGSVTAYKRNWMSGDHQLKAGWDYYLERRSEAIGTRAGGDYVEIFKGGVPFELETFNNPVVPLNAVNYGGAYAQDNWHVNQRLTLNLGVRYDRYNMFIPQQSRVAGTFAAAQTFPAVQFNIWNEVVPRVHAAYDVFGDAKTVIKGGWSRFGELREASCEPTVQSERSREHHLALESARRRDIVPAWASRISIRRVRHSCRARSRRTPWSTRPSSSRNGTSCRCRSSGSSPRTPRYGSPACTSARATCGSC